MEKVREEKSKIDLIKMEKRTRQDFPKKKR